MTLDKNSTTRGRVVIGAAPTELADIWRLAHGEARVELDPGVQARMLASYELVQQHRAEDRKIYGVTTGYGASVKNSIPGNSSAELSLNLLRFHGCGTGRLLTEVESAAVLAARLCSVTRGNSGVRPEVAERLRELLNLRILPAIPAEGSVGASGDLTPLSYVAAVLVGEREVLAPGGTRPALEVLAEHGLEPLTLGPKEALALMNGTSVASSLGALALCRARRLARLTARITALASRAIGGNPEHFDQVLQAMKGHPGQIRAAEWIRQELATIPGTATPVRLQDRYSIRCAPQVLGVLIEAIDWFERMLVTEINGVSDNPIIDMNEERILHGGNFYGGHVVFAMDGLKTAVANVADLLDRQLLLMCVPAESDGLPENLVGERGPDKNTHHGFKGMSITASALTAEALKHSVPASIFSRSTESHNQDKVPMATMGARDALRVVELTEQVAAIATLAGCQALELRVGNEPMGPLHEAVRREVPALIGDRRMDVDIAAVLSLMRAGHLAFESCAEER